MNLLSDARSARMYRDELDALREKAVRVDKLEKATGSKVNKKDPSGHHNWLFPITKLRNLALFYVWEDARVWGH